MIVKFWSDTNQNGFSDALGEMGIECTLHNSYEYEIPEELLSLAVEWGATEISHEE